MKDKVDLYVRYTQKAVYGKKKKQTIEKTK